MIYGGIDHDSKPLEDAWIYHTLQGTWSRLPDLKLYGSIKKPVMVVVDNILYVVDHTNEGEVVLYTLNLSTALSTWQEIVFPQQVSHPAARQGAILLSTNTGMGRKYLLYGFGEKLGSSENEAQYCSDIWSYQIDAPQKTAAKIKDVLKEGLGMNSDRATWAEVVVQADEETYGLQGKSHPGPRAYCAAANLDAKSFVTWGGLTAGGIAEGDGWIIKIE